MKKIKLRNHSQPIELALLSDFDIQLLIKRCELELKQREAKDKQQILLKEGD